MAVMDTYKNETPFIYTYAQKHKEHHTIKQSTLRNGTMAATITEQPGAKCWEMTWFFSGPDCMQAGISPICLQM